MLQAIPLLCKQTNRTPFVFLLLQTVLPGKYSKQYKHNFLFVSNF